MRPRYFAIIGAMRTGSNLLERTLANLGDTVCYGEAFNPSFIGGPRRKAVLGWTKEQRDHDPLGFLEHMIQVDKSKIPGFRIFNEHSLQVMDFVLADPECARIILTRAHLDSYVSLLMARATDQWMLNDPAKRISVRVSVDDNGFRAYRDRLEDYQRRIANVMEGAGTSAKRIDYAELTNPAALQKIASYIGSSGTVAAEPPILRQNPGTLADKVINHAQLCQALGMPIQRPACSAAGPAHVLHSRYGPLALAPITGPALMPLVALVQRIEARAYGAPQVPRAKLMGHPAETGLFDAGAPTGGTGAHPLSEKAYLTAVAHPFARMHHLFCDELFGQNWRKSWIRARIEHDIGALPDPKALAVDRPRPARHREAFQAFLRLCFSAEVDAQPYRPDWAPQAELIEAFTIQSNAPVVIRPDGLAAAAEQITCALGVAPIPPGQLSSLQSIAGRPVLPIEDVSEPDLEETVRAVFSVDYERLGYSPWCGPATPEH